MQPRNVALFSKKSSKGQVESTAFYLIFDVGAPSSVSPSRSATPECRLPRANAEAFTEEPVVPKRARSPRFRATR